MNGRKQIICRINSIDKQHNLIPKPVVRYYRPYIGCRKQQKASETDQSGQKIRREKPAHLFFLLPCYDDIIYRPKQITPDINDRRRSPERNQPVQRPFDIIVFPFSRNHSCSRIHCRIKSKCKQQRHRTFFWNHCGYFVYFFHITLRSFLFCHRIG